MTHTYKAKQPTYTPWGGGACPAPNARVHVIFQSGEQTEGNIPPVRAGSLAWRHKTQEHINDRQTPEGWKREVVKGKRYSNIVAYRIVQEETPIRLALIGALS